ncbi:MarR family winged helix-turn-helix transcriptional regulator [Microlunatus antarcticus]|uniref:DNA-binding MarR family transcriptional regulator n=1 Tax=Microlunatus antarcticus TaxID=53388 RepID=A0A7W5JV25_9ACTN|nr:MarR family transcriptional regulator [Microlunatus antarcticus]MBB3326836.1 DNA-binding MarR family transcriptional regulator [Microlunatus antarcticus]
MLYPTDERAADQRSVDDLLPTSPDGDGLAALDADAMAEAVRNLRALIMAGERYRLTAAGSVGLGATESSAISYLAVHGDRGQSELARDLNLTSSAATALVDRLERHGAAQRVRHPTDRRRTTIRLTVRGEELAAAAQRSLIASLELVASADLPLFSGWLRVVAADLDARTR